MIRESFEKPLDAASPAVTRVGPLVDARPVDGDERKLRGNETSGGGHQGDDGEQPNSGVDRSSWNELWTPANVVVP